MIHRNAYNDYWTLTNQQLPRLRTSWITAPTMGMSAGKRAASLPHYGKDIQRSERDTRRGRPTKLFPVLFARFIGKVGTGDYAFICQRELTGDGNAFSSPEK